MARKLSNISAALKDTKTRTLLIVVGIILLVGVGIGYIGLRRAEQKGPPVGASVQGAPSIKSIPGVGTPSREYVKTQEQENIIRAQIAAKEGTSAIPTITRTTYGPSEFEMPGIPTTATGSPECSPEALARARQAGVKAEELRCKGCTAEQLRAAGYTAGELLNAGFSANELRNAGFPAGDLRVAGFTAPEVARAGYPTTDMVAAGFNASELNQAGVGAAQLSAAGLSPQQLAVAGIGVKSSATLPKDCSVEALRKARSQGVLAAELRKMGCSAAALRAAGYTAKELKDAGFSAKELRDAGFSAAELKAAGFTAGELRQAGFSAKDLRNAGFSAADLREAGFGADELAAAGFSGDELKAAGFSDGELVRAGLTPTIPTTTVAAPSGPVRVITQAAPPPPVTPQVSPADAGLAALERLQQRQAEQLSQQERQDKIVQLQQGMSQQATDLFSVWSPPPTQQYVQGEPKQVGAVVTGPGGVPLTPQQLAAAAGGPPIIKAGTVMFGVLDTSLNSDEPSPILATVVTGPYKGTKLVGQFQRVDQRVIVNFTSMNIPSYQQSLGINAVAIDPNTARTALADDVDNHYLLRFGSLFASAFVSGYARATEQSGATTNITTAGISETGPDLDAGDKAIVGLGQVGNQLSNVLGNIFTRPPTVRVNAGAGIGVLFMADVSNTATPIAANQVYASPIGVNVPVTTTSVTPVLPSQIGSVPAVPVPVPVPTATVTAIPTPTTVRAAALSPTS